MEVTRTVTIKLSREELVEIIKNYLSQEGLVLDEKSIDFDVKSVTTGPQWDSYTTVKLYGVTATCKMKTERIDK